MFWSLSKTWVVVKCPWFWADSSECSPHLWTAVLYSGEKENSLKTDDYGRDLSSVQTLLTKQVRPRFPRYSCLLFVVRVGSSLSQFFSSAGNIWRRSAGFPAGGHHQHHCSEGPAAHCQARPVQSHRGSPCGSDKTLEPAAVQLCCTKEEASWGPGALQKGWGSRLSVRILYILLLSDLSL